MYGSFWYNVCIKAVAEIDRIDIITTLPDQCVVQNESTARGRTYHSKSLYIMVKKTCRKRLTALISTASRYSHASPDIIVMFAVDPTTSRDYLAICHTTSGLQVTGTVTEEVQCFNQSSSSDEG